jgi:S-adenosylmethionine:tRNA ribosyltransferase-isomerase
LGHTRGKLTPGESITLLDAQGREDVRLDLISKDTEGNWIVQPASSEPTYDILERVGRIPLPPYIRSGEMTESDRQNYQTVFAREPGSVAAPTAGLHFSEKLLEKIKLRGVTVVYLTLHVGLGTFRPISVENLAEHQMHSEWGTISVEAVETILDCRRKGGRVIAAGTTSVRLLETAAAGGTLQPFRGETDLFIRPPYEFKIVDCMMTNFHLPRTTLLILVRTLGGDELIRRAYQEAIEERYRFYSYGDAMLIV